MLDFTTILVAIVVLYVISSIKILAEYERAVIFRLGRVLEKPKGPGVILVFVPIDRIVRVSLRLEKLRWRPRLPSRPKRPRSSRTDSPPHPMANAGAATPSPSTVPALTR